MSTIKLDRARKVFANGVVGVADVSLSVAEGELLVVLGPSGCGKTTLLRLIAGLEPLTSGRLWLDGKLANGLTPRARNTAMVFESGALYPHLKVRGNLAFPLENAGVDAAEIDRRVSDLAESLGISDTLDRGTDTLSAGQRQRVAMGRAIIREPSIFLMDEPLSNLDAGMRTDLRAEIAGLIRSLGVTTVYVTHDQTEALILADRIALLAGGRLQDVGTPEQVYNDPANMFSAAFLSAPRMNLLPASVAVHGGVAVTLELGSQQLRLPWADPRSYALLRHHGKVVAVGLRPDSLSPVGAPVGAVGGPVGDLVLSGQIRMVEYHGHEWLLHVETGLDMITDPRPEPGTGEMRGTHRRADLIVRLGSAQGVARGQRIHLTIDPRRLMLFDPSGARVGAVRR